MTRLKIVEDPHAPEELERRVREGVDLHNVAATGLDDWSPVALFLKTDGGEVRGGLLGHVWAGAMHITYLWVAQPFRGRRWGSKLLRRAEAIARERGVATILLESHSFQAPDFYLEHGYHCFAVLDDYPPGHSQHFLVKRLRPRSK